MTAPPCAPHTSSSLLFIPFLWLLYVYVRPRSRTDAILPDKREASYNIPAGVPRRLACDPGCNSSNREPSPTPQPAPPPSSAAAVVQGQPDGFRSRGATAIVITRLIGLSVFMAASDLSELKHSAGSDPTLAVQTVIRVIAQTDVDQLGSLSLSLVVVFPFFSCFFFLHFFSSFFSFSFLGRGGGGPFFLFFFLSVFIIYNFVLFFLPLFHSL